MVAEHHEKFDGTGYPFELKGDKISLYARICNIMDVFGALTAPRKNRPGMTPFADLTEMKNNMEGQFDMRILVNFIKTLADAAAAKVSASKTAGTSRSSSNQVAASAWLVLSLKNHPRIFPAYLLFVPFSFRPDSSDLFFTLPAE